MTKGAVDTATKKTSKKPDEPYKEMLEFPETGKVSLCQDTNYQVSVSIGPKSSRMRPIVCEFDTGTGPNLIRADILDNYCPDSIRKYNMPDMGSSSNTRLKVSETIILHPLIGEAHTRVNFGIVGELVVPYDWKRHTSTALSSRYTRPNGKSSFTTACRRHY